MSASPYIKSNPSLLVKIFDAIETCRKSQQPATLANIYKALDARPPDVEREIRCAADDGFLVPDRDIFLIPPFDQSPIFRRSHDSFCHNCHGSGQVLECESCWRVSHASCCPVSAPTTKGKFICSMCRQIRSAQTNAFLDSKRLNRLLIFIVCILRERFKEHFLDPDRLKNPIYRNLMFKFVSFETIEDKIINNTYRTPLEFLCDIQSMFHCFVLASGTECSTTADLLYNYAHYELDELEICPTCYLLSNTKPENWFSIPCTPPHRLVYAKQKGYSYWPAKIVQSVKPHREDVEVFDGNAEEEATSFDVRYFGGNHERAFIETDCLKPIESDVQKLVPKRTVAFTKAMEELGIHQKYNADGPQKYAPIVDNLWAVTDWRGEIESEKARKAQLILGTANNGKAKRARGKSSITSQRVSPTPTSSTTTGPGDGDSRDASISDLIVDSPGVATLSSRPAEKESHAPLKIQTTNRRSVVKAPAAEQQNPEVAENPVAKQSNGEGKSRSTVANRSSLPSPSANVEVVAKKPTSPPIRNLRNQDATATPIVTQPVQSSNATSVPSKSANSVANVKQEKQETPARSTVRTPAHISLPATTLTAPIPKIEPPKVPPGPCGPGSCCAEAYERKVAEAKREFDSKMKQLQEKLESDRRNELASMERRFSEENAKLQKQQLEEIAAVKRKQWCVNCSQEAFFPCCWNTAYCSQHCQQEHWYHEHKRFCRRRRPQDSSTSGPSANSAASGSQTSAAQLAAGTVASSGNI